MRFLAALFFLGLGTYVWWYNQNHLDRIVLAYVLDWVFPASRGDIQLQGRLSAYVAWGAGALFLLRDLYWWWRERQNA